MEDIGVRQTRANRLVNMAAIGLLVIGMTGPVQPCIFFIFSPASLPDKWALLLLWDGYPFLFAGLFFLRRPPQEKLAVAVGLIICYSVLSLLVPLLALMWFGMP